MSKTEKLWDKMSKIYDKETKHLDWVNTKVAENTKKYLNGSDSVLEIGCGTGTITIEIADKVKEIHAIDISSKMLEIAERKAGERKIENIDFSQSTIFVERYKRESYDVILAFNVLHYFEDTQKVMKRINELLKPGGWFMSVTPCSGETQKSFSDILKILRNIVFLLPKIGIVPFPYIRFFTPSELEDSIAHGKFQIVEAENWHGPEEHYFIAAKKNH
ncbi:MAG: class I SAM-dependent methyltransferase [Anaerolineae bacterium]|nr:class I SAM-dependent methyltransferase [Anaerolineae bacterium]